MDSSSSSLNFGHRWTYDVFINFRGKDTRESFVPHLHAALTNAGINTYIDTQIHKGTELDPELSRAIDCSRMSILVISKNYTESSSCLYELQHAIYCRKCYGQIVLPVFYDVQPSDVRRQKGEFGQVLRATAKKVSNGRGMKLFLSRWSAALSEAASIIGWVATNYRYGDGIVQQIVEDVSTKLKGRSLKITEFPVGLDSRVQQMIQFIENHSTKVRMIRIWGMTGSGKTTTTKAIYNQIHHKFDDHSFVENIRQVCTKGEGEIIHLQEQLVSDVMKIKVKIHSTAYGVDTIEKRFTRNYIALQEQLVSDVVLFGFIQKLHFFSPTSIGKEKELVFIKQTLIWAYK